MIISEMEYDSVFKICHKGNILDQLIENKVFN